MPELGSYGSVRGAAGNSLPYRDCRHDEAIHALRRPASEKRQGTKSREVGHRWCRGRLLRFSRGTLIRLVAPAEQQTGARQRVIEPGERREDSARRQTLEERLAFPEPVQRLARLAELRPEKFRS